MSPTTTRSLRRQFKTLKSRPEFPERPLLLKFSLRDTIDAIENVAGYVPVGIVFAWLGPLRAVLAAAGISSFAENSQLFMMHRDPEVVD
jgi:hypothetical protein